MDVEIRRYNDSDFEKVFTIIKENFQLEKARESKSTDSLEFVAVIDKQVVGYFILRRVFDIVKANNYYFLEYVCVDKALQNKGIGQKIMEFVINFAKEEKASYIELTSSYTREVAHHIYEKYGFVKRESNIFRRSV